MSKPNVELHAYIFSAALVVILGILVIQFLFPVLFPKDEITQDEDFSILETSVNQEELEVDDAATIGQKFIKTLAFYEELGETPILLESTEEVDHDQFLTDYTLATDTLLYHIEVEVLSGYVVNHKIHVENITKTIEVTEPEPLAVIASERLAVRGMMKEYNEVTMALFTATGELAKKETIKQVNEDTLVYAHTMNISSLAPGKYFLEIKSVEEKVVYPIIIASSI